MNKTLFIAVVAALPVFAQGEMPKTKDIPVPAPGMEMPRHWGAAGEMPQAPGRDDFHKKMLEKFDADKDGQISDAEKEAMKAEMQKRHGKKGERPGMDGKRPEKGEFPGMDGKRPEKGEFPGMDGKRPEKGEFPGMDGKRPGREDMQKKMLEKFDTDKDGQLSDAEKEAMKAARPQRPGRGEGKGRGPKGPRGPQGGQAPQGADVPVTLPL